MIPVAFVLFACAPEPEDSGVDSADTSDTGDTSDTADTGDSDTATEPPWPDCPDASAYVGDQGWTGAVQATADAVYCSASNEVRTLEEERAYKARLRIVEGTWPLPADEGTYELALPVCFQRADPQAQPAMAGTGDTTVSPSSFGGTTYTYLRGDQPLASPSGQDWTLEHTLVLVGDEGATPDTLVMQGWENDEESGAGAGFTLYPSGGSPYATDAMPFSPCSDPTWVDNVHTVAFDGGEIELELFLGDDPIITAPGNFHHASGTLDGTAFDVTDFFLLVYRPGHHHLDRHFAVVFDPPIGDVCALRIEDVDMQEGTTTARVSTAACDLSVIEERAVTAEDFTTIPP